MREASSANRVRLYESLLDSLNDSVLVFDAEQRLYFVNQRFCDATGLEQPRLVGTPIEELRTFVTDDSFPALRSHIEDVLAGATDERRIDLSVRSPLEGSVVVEARLTPVAGLDEPGCAVVLRDLTTKLDQEKALKHKIDQLAVLTRLLRHDIRNDMNVIVGWADQLTKFDPTEDEQEIIDRITRRGAHTIELTYAVRDLLEAIDNEWDLETEPIELRQTIENEVTLVREQYPEALFIEATPLPAVTVAANRLLGSVIHNVLSNAVRHNNQAGPEVAISITETAETVRLAIADNGPGIPDSQKTAVYEMGNKGPESPGVGLGLYLVKSLVDAYGGTVEITDNSPRGSVLTITLDRIQRQP